MALPTLTGVCRLTADPELRFSTSGVAVCTMHLAFNARSKNPQTGEWEDGDTFFVKAVGFKDLAEHVAESLTRGTEIIITGRMKTESWEAKDGGGKRTAPSLLVDSVGPSLRYATAKVDKAKRSTGTPGTDEPPF